MGRFIPTKNQRRKVKQVYPLFFDVKNPCKINQKNLLLQRADYIRYIFLNMEVHIQNTKRHLQKNTNRAVGAVILGVEFMAEMK